MIYERAIAILCLGLPYIWRTPDLWYLAFLVTTLSYWLSSRIIGRIEALRKTKALNKNYAGPVITLGAMFIAHGTLIKYFP